MESVLACQTRLLLQSGYAVRIIAGVVNQTVLRVEAVAIPFMYGGHSQIAPLQAALQEDRRASAWLTSLAGGDCAWDARRVITGPPGLHSPANWAYLEELRHLRTA